MPFHPVIAPEIFALRPDFTALSLHVTGIANRPSDAASARHLDEAIAAMGEAPWAEAHLDARREAYRALGAKPNKTLPSGEALRKRAAKDGAIRPANAVVDLYNATSIRFAIPVGGEDVAGYVGSPTLRRATGTETFDTMADGAPKLETLDAGEVFWGDDQGATCRRWNWRQGVRTQITEATADMWFVLERLDAMPMEALMEAGASLLQGLRQLSPGAAVAAQVFSIAAPVGQQTDLPV